MGAENEFTKDHIMNWPGVSPHAVAQETGNGEKRAENVNHNFRDPDGNPFNIDLHLWDKENDKPKYTQKGYFKKRPKRKSKEERQADHKKSGLDLSAVSSKDQPDLGEISSEQAALMTVQLVVAAGMYLDPEEGKPGQDVFGRDEFQSGLYAYKTCYEYYGIDYIPPWLAPTIWTTTYFGKRIAKSEDAQSKVKVFWAWCKTKLPRFRRKKKQHTESDV